MNRVPSICFLAARATLQLNDKMALQTQVASFPTSALRRKYIPVNSERVMTSDSLESKQV